MKGLTAKDVMNADVLSVPPDMSVHEVAVFLVEHQISGAPVLDHHGQLVGLVSLTDIAESDALRDDPREADAPRRRRGRTRQDLAGLRVQTADLLVRDIMTPTIYAVELDTPVAELAHTMIAGRIHRLLVTAEGRVAGIVTSLDLLRLLVGKAPARIAIRRPTRMHGKGAALLVALVALVSAACSRASSADSAPGAAASPAASASSAIEPSASLPPGHPPLDSKPATALPQGHPAVGGAAVPGESVRGTVTLAPALRERAPKGAALFLIARAADKRIVAVRKADAVTFPYAFTVSGEDAMTHGSGWSGVLEITARLSRSGDAAPAPGDLEGRAAGVSVGAQGVRIELDQVRP